MRDTRRMGPARLRALVTVAVTAITLAGPNSSVARISAVRVTVGQTARTAPTPGGFVGLALEYGGLPQWVASEGPANPVLVRLIRNLNPVGRPVIRIGGLSTDHTWWPGSGVTAPLGATIALSPAWANSARALAEALDARLVLGINLEANSRPLARVEAAEFVTQIGRRWIGAMDIGNEPPLYSSVPWYRILKGRVIPWYSTDGTPVPGRSLIWGPDAFTNEFAQLTSVLPSVPIAGPDTQQPKWFAAWARLLAPRSRVRMVVSHGYGLNNCVANPNSPAYPSVQHLLGAYASRDLLGGLQPYVELAHRDGASFRIDEMGSITCNGRWGVANTMASALWMANALFTVARAGIDGVNLHTYPGLSNALFDFTPSAGGWVGTVHPMYYGALLFVHAAPAGSHLVANTETGPPMVHAWSTAGPGRRRHVLLVNESSTEATAAQVRVVPGSDPSPATIERLLAPSAYATTGITLGGRSFGGQTASGVLPAPVPQSVVPHRGIYRIKLPAASAVLLSFDTNSAS